MENIDRQLKDKAIDFKGSEYVQVKDRVNYIVDNYEGRYEVLQDYKFFEESKTRVVKTTLVIRDETHEDCCKYEWLAQEVEGTTFINKTSALENCATSSLGRAIACLWIWVIDSFASMNEIEKAENRAKQEEKKEEKKVSNDLPRFNEPELKGLEKNQDWLKWFKTSDDLLKTIETKYRISKEMKLKIADYRASL